MIVPRTYPGVIHNIHRSRAHTEAFLYGSMQAPREGLRMRDWQAELDDLLKQTTNLVKTADLKAEVPRVPARAVVEPFNLPRVAKSGGSQREEIMKRVAIFKAHQQRAIRDREQYATSVLMKMKATLKTWS